MLRRIVLLGTATTLATAPLVPAPANATAARDAGRCERASLEFGGTVCIDVKGVSTTVTRVQGSVYENHHGCNQAFKLSGTGTNGAYNSYKRVRHCEDEEYVWTPSTGIRFKANTDLCIQAGIYHPSTGTSTWDTAKACIEIQP